MLFFSLLYIRTCNLTSDLNSYSVLSVPDVSQKDPPSWTASYGYTTGQITRLLNANVIVSDHFLTIPSFMFV